MDAVDTSLSTPSVRQLDSDARGGVGVLARNGHKEQCSCHQNGEEIVCQGRYAIVVEGTTKSATCEPQASSCNAGRERDHVCRQRDAAGRLLR